MTATDLTAADIVWDLEPLLPAPDDAGIDAAARRGRREGRRARGGPRQGRRRSTPTGSSTFMHGLAEVHDLIGRAGSFVGLDFAADTTDPARGARMQMVEERSTVIGTKLLFFELEWAELPDEQVEALLADDRLAFAAHHLRSARRYRPHLLTEPEEVVLTEKSVTGPQRVGAAVRRAGLGDHDRARRRDHHARSRASRGCTHPTARCARPRPPR